MSYPTDDASSAEQETGWLRTVADEAVRVALQPSPAETRENLQWIARHRVTIIQ